jgi:hypothetical protein
LTKAFPTIVVPAEDDGDGNAAIAKFLLIYKLALALSKINKHAGSSLRLPLGTCVLRPPDI